MFWICVACNELGDFVPVTGSMNQLQYLSVLNNNAFTSGERLIEQSLILQRDNVPCHKAKIITTFLKDVRETTLDWPPLSPYLNIIENV